MKTGVRSIVLCTMLFVSPFLAGAVGDTRGPEAEQADLEARRRELGAQVAKLTHERAFLLFEKEFAEADSKYLVLDPARGRGQLKFRARVLLDFSFATIARTRDKTVLPGPRAVTGKSEDRKKQRILAFGPLLVVCSKNAAMQEPAALRIVPGEKDMRSIFYALEKGSMAYILP